MNTFVYLSALINFRKQKKLHTCITLIALVVAPLILALVISESMMTSIEEKFVCLSSGHITLYGTDDISEIEEFVKSGDQTINGSALAYSSSSTQTLLIKGVKSDYFTEDRLKHITFSVADSDKASNSTAAKISISKTTAESLGVSYGDKIVLMVVPDNENSVLRPVIVTIDEIYTTGYNQFDENVAFVDYNWAEKIWTDVYSHYTEIILKEEYSSNLYDVQYMLGDKISSTWIDSNSTIYSNFITSKQMIMVILILIVFVAAFYTASVAQQIVQDRKRQISISKLLGASDRQLRLSSLISVTAAVITGISIGLILGLGLSFALNPLFNLLSSLSIEALSYYLLSFEISVPVVSIAVLLVSLLLISIITVYISLSRIRKITPIQLFLKT